MAPYSRNDLLLGRQDASILVLFKTFVPCVIGRKKFKMKSSEQLKRDADICTVSDEAFALLILENQYDRWSDIFEQRKLNATEITIRSERPKQKWESDVSPKYTDGGIIYKDGRKMTHKGWREAGIERFNTICKKVAADCKDNPAIVERLKAWQSASNHVTKLKAPLNEEWANGPTPYHQLWDNMDETDEASGGNMWGGEEQTTVLTMGTAI